MKVRIFSFFAIITIIFFSYFIGDFNENSTVENRTLKTSFEFEDGIKKGILDASFQDQLEEIMSDQILGRNFQVTLESKISKTFGINKRFYDDYYLLNDKTVLNLTDYVSEDNKEILDDQFFNQINIATNQLADVGADLYGLYIDLESYYCVRENDNCTIDVPLDNYFILNDLTSDEYAFNAGDHHITIDSQYAVFSQYMNKLGLCEYVKPLDYYYDTSYEFNTNGSREVAAKNAFGLKGYEYAPQPLDDATITQGEETEQFNNTELSDKLMENPNPKKNSNRIYITPGYCGVSKEETTDGKYYVANPNALVDEKILIIGDSQICAASAFYYQTFKEVHTFDKRYQFIDVVSYVEENDIDHVLMYGNLNTGLDKWFDFSIGGN